MYYNSIYSQLFNFIPRYRFEKIVKKQRGPILQAFHCVELFLTSLFAQNSGKAPLREIKITQLADQAGIY